MQISPFLSSFFDMFCIITLILKVCYIYKSTLKKWKELCYNSFTVLEMTHKKIASVTELKIFRIIAYEKIIIMRGVKSGQTYYRRR